MDDTSKQIKSILITGCSSGIGLALAKALHQHTDYHVLATARKDEDLNMLSELGIENFYLDLADSQSVQSCFSWTVNSANNQQIFGLINNAAYGQPGAVEDLSRQALLQQFEANVFGTHELTTLILKHMREINPQNPQGRIIQISSILGLCCLPYRGAYNASKYALEALTDSLRLELNDTNIKFTLIEPGPIRSAFRPNALAMFHQHIDIEASAHSKHYKAVLSRLSSSKEAKFTLPAESLLPIVIKALESHRPKIRVTVTWPAHILAQLKRILPARWLDYLITHKFNN